MLRVCAGKKEVNMEKYKVQINDPGAKLIEVDAEKFHVLEHGDLVFFKYITAQSAYVQKMAFARKAWVTVQEA